MLKVFLIWLFNLLFLLSGFTLISAQEPLPQEEIRIGVSAMISPYETFSYYIDLVDYIGEKLGVSAKLIQRKTYEEMNELLETKRVEAAFICSGPYVAGHKKFGLEILAAPQVAGRILYYAYIIVHKDSPIENFSQLRQKTFAFTDPNSNTGKLVPTYMLAKMNETPESFFKNFIYTYSHDNSIKAVADRVVDGVSVDSLIYDYIKAKYPSSVAATKIIEKSQGFGIPPFAAHPDLEPALKTKLKQILLNMHQDEKGKKILSGIMIERFVEVDDSRYDSVRNMEEWLNK